MLASKLKQVTNQHTMQDRDLAISTSDKTWTIFNKIFTTIIPGKTEDACCAAIKRNLANMNITRLIHKPFVRFATNTLLQNRFTKMGNLALQSDDIAIIKIGIIVDGIEGHTGCTVVFGDDFEKHLLKNAAKALFDMGVDFLHSHNPTGIEMYQYLYASSKAMGYDFNLNPAGYLIGHTPFVHRKRGLNTFTQPIEPAQWVLQIQIRHKVFDYGALYESLLF